MTDRRTRLIFGSAALFNFCAGVPLLLATAWMGELMTLNLNPSGQMFLRLIAIMMIVFAWAYWMIGVDPVRYRPYLVLGGVLKVAVVIMFSSAWLSGISGPQLPALALGDVLYAWLFYDYYRRNAAILRGNSQRADEEIG